jgi:hypothetical protein
VWYLRHDHLLHYLLDGGHLDHVLCANLNDWLCVLRDRTLHFAGFLARSHRLYIG